MFMASTPPRWSMPFPQIPGEKLTEITCESQCWVNGFNGGIQIFHSFDTWAIHDKLFYIKSNKIVQLFNHCFQIYLHIDINSSLLNLNHHESNMETSFTNLQFTWLKNTTYVTFTANMSWSSEGTVNIHLAALPRGPAINVVESSFP